MTVEEKQGDKNGEYRKMETENKDVRPENDWEGKPLFSIKILVEYVEKDCYFWIV